MSRGSGRGNVIVDNENPTEAIKIYEDGVTIYVCKAAIGSSLSSPVWQISKITTTNPVTIQWADGNSLYDNVATNLSVVALLAYA